MDWGFIEKTFVMTTGDGYDISQHLHHIGLKHQIMRFPSVGHTNNVAGKSLTMWNILCHDMTDHVSDRIATNHILLLQKAYQEGANNVLILEDDARFETPLCPDKLARIQDWLLHHEYDLFYFGYCPWPLPFSFLITRDIVRIVSPYTCHAYMVSRTGMKKILDYIGDRDIHHLGIHYDKLLNDISGLHKFGTYPNLNFQNKDPALYKEGIRKLFPKDVYPSFRSTVRSLEHMSVVLPFVFIFVCCYIVVSSVTCLPMK